jgi:hypothetical protein
VNVGVLGLGYLGAVTAARVISDGHDVWRGDVGGPPELDEIWTVAGRQRRVWPTQPHRGLVRSSRRSASCMAKSIRRFSLISAGKMLAIARHPGLSAGDYIDQTFARSRVIAATVQVIPSLPWTDIAVKVGVRRGAEVILVVATCPRPLSLRSPAPGRSRRVTRDQAGHLRLLSCAGSPSGSSGTGGTTRVGLPALSVALRDERARHRRVGGPVMPAAHGHGRRPLGDAGTGMGCLPQPALLAARAQQHLCHRQAKQLRVGQRPRLPATGPASGDHMVADLHIQCDQEGIRVRSHNRSWMPSPPSRQQGR